MDLSDLAEEIAAVAHRCWCKRMLAQGWTLGDRIDPDERTHDAIRPFHELSPFDREQIRQRVEWEECERHLADAITDALDERELTEQDLRPGMLVRLFDAPLREDLTREPAFAELPLADPDAHALHRLAPEHLRPRTTTPSSVSPTAWMKTSSTSWMSLWRSTGGFTSVWFMKYTRSWDSRYHRRAFSSYGAATCGRGSGEPARVVPADASNWTAARRFASGSILDPRSRYASLSKPAARGGMTGEIADSMAFGRLTSAAPAGYA